MKTQVISGNFLPRVISVRAHLPNLTYSLSLSGENRVRVLGKPCNAGTALAACSIKTSFATVCVAHIILVLADHDSLEFEAGEQSFAPRVRKYLRIERGIGRGAGLASNRSGGHRALSAHFEFVG